MDWIDLPRIDTDATLNDAIALMKAKGRSGVLVELAAGPKVLDVDVILHALREGGNQKISAVEPRVVTLNLPGKRAAAQVLSSEKARFKAQQQMDAGRAVYAVTRVVGGMAHVLARHEPYRDVLQRAPSMWRCRKDSDHVWLTDDLFQPGDKCRNDGSAVDLI